MLKIYGVTFKTAGKIIIVSTINNYVIFNVYLQ